MISYAQNFEDVLLERAFAEVREGFYVDVGAFHPSEDSVTQHFYLKGWCGINIEPIPELLARFYVDRPRDTNLRVAVGDGSSTELYVIEGTAMSTASPVFAARAGEQGYSSQSRLVVETVSLRRILDAFGQPDIHFLKIDCEGAEADALESMDFVRHRPWVVLVEAVEPFLRKPNYENWEGSLTSNGYRFVYFDGLNRFYVANERVDIDRAFETPPNVFDNIIRARETNLREKYEEEIASLQSELSRLSTAPAGAFVTAPAGRTLDDRLEERVSLLTDKAAKAQAKWLND